MVLDILVRIVIAIIFALLSVVFLTFSLFILRKESILKHNISVGIIFAVGLFIFSFLNNYIFSVIVALIALLSIKFFYIHNWRDTLSAWAVWMVMWLILFGFIALIVSVIEPTSII